MKPQNKNSRTERSGKRGGHLIGPLFPIHLSDIVVLRKSLHTLVPSFFESILIHQLLLAAVGDAVYIIFSYFYNFSIMSFSDTLPLMSSNKSEISNCSCTELFAKILFYFLFSMLSMNLFINIWIQSSITLFIFNLIALNYLNLNF